MNGNISHTNAMSTPKLFTLVVPYVNSKSVDGSRRILLGAFDWFNQYYDIPLSSFLSLNLWMWHLFYELISVTGPVYSNQSRRTKEKRLWRRTLQWFRREGREGRTRDWSGSERAAGRMRLGSGQRWDVEIEVRAGTFPWTLSSQQILFIHHSSSTCIDMNF